MPYFEKTESGKWRVTSKVNGKRLTKTVLTKAEGKAWDMTLRLNPGQKVIPNKTFGELLENYRDKVSVNKPGERWERIRIEKFLKDPIAKVPIAILSKSNIADWRDRRVKEVSNLSVIREWALLSHALQIAIDEWEWLTINPMKGVKKPIAEAPRDRLITGDEIENLCFALNYDKQSDLKMKTSRVGAAFVFAIETALRTKEICNLRWVDIDGRVIKVIDSKTRAGIRKVPLSERAQEIVKQCEGLDDYLVFNITPSQIDSLFRKAKGQNLIKDLHFHDTRHEAITRLSKKLPILALARVIGHKDLKMLLIYYNETAENLAHLL